MTDHEALRETVLAVRTWNRGEQRAPHKPLLLLLALGRVQRGEPRLVGFTEIEGNLRRLITEFGPTRDSYHPEYPFWRLQRDDLWEIPDGAALRKRQSNTDPPITELRKVSGGFPPAVQDALRGDPNLVRELAHAVLDEHFPSSVHESIIAAAGLDLDPPMIASRRRARDRAFRDLVLRAYGYRCAVCGLDAQLDGMSIGLDGAHVQWHRNLGPDTVDNGLALCPLHHRSLDLGLITIGEGREVLVSERLGGSEVVEHQIGRFHRNALLGPLHGAPPIDLRHAAWHRREVFKGAERAA